MFAGFQSNAFQQSGFQILTSGAVAPVAIGGHFSDYNLYRKQLKKMLAAAEARDAGKYKAESEKLVQQAISIEPDIQPIVARTETTTQDVVDIDFTKAISELNRLLLRVERVIELRKLELLKKREEEEIIFLLALS